MPFKNQKSFIAAPELIGGLRRAAEEPDPRLEIAGIADTMSRSGGSAIQKSGCRKKEGIWILKNSRNSS